MKLILNKHQLYYYLCLGKSQVTQKSTDQPGWCRLCEVGNLQVWCFFGCHRIGRHCSPPGRGRDRAGADAGSSASTHQCSVNRAHPPSLHVSTNVVHDYLNLGPTSILHTNTTRFLHSWNITGFPRKAAVASSARS